MELAIRIEHSVEAVGQPEWDRLSGGRPFAGYRWYRFAEQVLTDSRPVYILAYAGGELVARAAFWLLTNEPLPLRFSPLRRLMGAVVRRRPLLACRTPLASTSGLILPEGPLQRMALESISRAALEAGRSYGTLCVLYDYLDKTEAEAIDWPSPFVAMQLPDPGTCLPIVWPNFESYLEQLSYKTRKNYRRNCRAAQTLGLTVTPYRQVQQLDRVIELARNVERRYHEPHTPWTRRVLELAGMVDGVWLAAEVNGRLVGCELLLYDQGVGFVTTLGLDYTIPGVYFQLAYADIRYAIENGLRLLRWGSGAYEFKQRLGFQLEHNNYIAAALPNRAMRWVAQRLAAV